ncbi:uncharacterized protein LOC111603921 [Drosophila hydei]|uniref:Uncharacterized protein LOC111603921 n=1 Tax=Drosophila hydei TaxID=7224 RepID=A0A6J1MAR5_DROHY|nr:uncharacterized protein LOC111603921 [Drosophila hydei]
MSCLKGACGCYAKSPFSGSLGKSFHLSDACNSCVCRIGYSGTGGTKTCVGCRTKKPVPERIQWLRRYRVHLANERNCDCRSASPKDYWYDTNRETIKSLGRAFDVPVDQLADFLYMLTMQNFSAMLNPHGSCFAGYRLPFYKSDTCNLYASIFDDEGNVRTPFSPGALISLLTVLQQVLLQDHQPPHPPELPFFMEKKKYKSSKLKERLKLVSFDSLNRRFDIPETLQIKNPNPLDYRQAPFANALDVAAPSSKQLRHLMDVVRYKSNIKIDFASSLEKLDLKAASTSNAKRQSLQKLSKGVAREYSYLIQNDQPRLSTPRTSLPRETTETIEEPPTKEQEHLYFGEPIPVLMHKPFNPKESETFLRRAPKQLRVDDNGNVVDSKNLRRYRRETIEDLLKDARKTRSIHSLVSVDSEDNSIASRKS